MRLVNVELLNALADLVKQRGTKNLAERINLGLQLLERLNGKHGEGWSNEPQPLQTSATPKASAAIDLGDEIRRAREKSAAIEKQLQELGEEAPPSLYKEASDAADLVRRLVATQNEVNPGGDIQGEFHVGVSLPGGADDGAVPNLVADRQEPAAPVEVEETKPEVPAEKSLDDIESEDADG